MADKFSEFGIDIGLSASGFDSVLAKFKHLSTEGEKIGKTTNEITKAMERLKTAMEHALNVDSAKKRLEQFTTKDGDRKRELAQEIANNTQKLLNIQNAWERAKKGFGDGGSVFGSLEKAIKTLTGGWVQLNTAMRPVKMMYRWVDGVAKLNMQLRMLHYSSGMAIASLKSYGAAASRYGGSENTVASYAERHQMQLTRARQGLGLGHFQDVAWKYGFGFNASESPEKRFHRAIEEMRSGKIAKDNWLAFAHEEAPMRAKELMSYASRKDGLKVYEHLQAYAQSLQELTDENGKIISAELSEQSEKLADSQFLLNEQWKSIREQFAYHLMPVVQSLTDKIVGMMEWFNELDPKKKRIAAELTGLVGAIVGAIGALGVFKLTFSKLWGLLKYVFPFLKNIGGGASGGAGGGFGGGGAAKGLPKIPGIGGRGGFIGSLINLIPQSISAGANVATGMFTAESANSLEFILKEVRSINSILFENYSIKRPKDDTKEILQPETTAEDASWGKEIYSAISEIGVQLEKGVYVNDATTKLMATEIANAIGSNGGNSGDGKIVKQDNRTFNIEQHFVSSGDVRKDAEDARDAMQERNMLDLSIN